jgi:hypothetical protein
VAAGDLINHDVVKREIDEWLRSVPAEARPDRAALESGVVAADGVADQEVVSYHLEREGHFTVLVPDRPVPPLDPDIVNQILDEMEQERLDRWLKPSAEHS